LREEEFPRTLPLTPGGKVRYNTQGIFRKAEAAKTCPLPNRFFEAKNIRVLRSW